MSYLNLTATLGLNYVVTEPLLLADQPLLATPRIAANYTLANGLVAVTDAIDDHFEDTPRTLAGSASHTYVLSALTDTLPRTIAFTDIKTVIIKVTIRTAGDFLTISPGVTHGWVALVPSGSIKIYGLFVFHVDKTDSLPVVASTTDQLTVTNGGSNPITYTIAFAGNSG